MSHRLTIELMDEDFEPIREAAASAGMSPEQWLSHQATAYAPSPRRRNEALARLLAMTGSMDVGATGIDNASIDRDLAREYGNTDRTDAA